MTALLIVLGIILVLLLLRLSLTLQYGEDGALVRAGVGPVRLTLYPRREKPEKRKKRTERQEEQEDRGGGLDMLRDGLSLVRPIAARVRRRLLIRELTLHYTAATKDAAMTALAYGGACAAVSSLLPLLTYNFRVKKQDIKIQADFDSEENRVFVRLRFSLAVWELIYLAVTVGALVAKSGLLSKPLKTSEAQTPEQTTA